MTDASGTEPIAERDHWIDTAGGRVFAHSWTPMGVGALAEPVLLLHDSLGSVALWRDFPAALCRASSRRVIAYDRLGFGQSSPRDALPSLRFVEEEAATSVAALLAAFGVGPFIALGHSVGGGMALHAALRHPQACRAVVTIAAQVFAEDVTLAGIRAAQRLFEDPVQRARLARYHGPRGDWVLRAWTDTWLDPAMADWSLVPELPGISCPVLAIHGERDEYGSTRHAQLIGTHCSGPTRVELLAGIGHVPQREQPEAVVALVADFLSTI